MSPPVALKKAARTAGETASARLISVRSVVRIHLSPPVYLENCIESKFAEKKRRNIKSNESKRVESI